MHKNGYIIVSLIQSGTTVSHQDMCPYNSALPPNITSGVEKQRKHIGRYSSKANHRMSEASHIQTLFIKIKKIKKLL